MGAWWRTTGRLMAVAALVGAVVAGGLIALPIALEDGYSPAMWFVVLAGVVLAVLIQLANVLLFAFLRAGGFTGPALRVGLVALPVLVLSFLVTEFVWESDGMFRAVWIAPVLVTGAAAWFLAPWCLAPLSGRVSAQE